MASLMNLSLISLLTIALACLIQSATINNATDSIEGNSLLTKRSRSCSHKKVELAPRSTCTYDEFFTYYKKRALDITPKQSFVTTDYGSRRIRFNKKKERKCRDYKIDQSGYYIVYLRCDPDAGDPLDGMSVVVNRHKTKIKSKLGCMTSGGKVTSSQIAFNLCKGDILETEHVLIRGAASEVQIVLYKETDGCGFDPKLVHNIHKRNSSPHRDVLNKLYSLDYQSKPSLSLGNIVKRGAIFYCQRFSLSNTGVYWIMFTVVGLRTGSRRYSLALTRERKRITLFEVGRTTYYQSRAVAAFAPSNSFIYVASDSKQGCDSDSVSYSRIRYQVSTAYLGRNRFKDGYIYGSYKVSDHYEIKKWDSLVFHEFVDRFQEKSINTKILSTPLFYYGRNSHVIFNAPEAGRYIINLQVRSRDELAFITQYKDCKNKFVTIDAVFYFEHLNSAQIHVLYMDKGGAIRVLLNKIPDRGAKARIGVDSTFSIAYVYPL